MMDPKDFIDLEIVLDSDKLISILELSEREERYDVIHPIIFCNSSFHTLERIETQINKSPSAWVSKPNTSWTLCPPELINNFSLAPKQHANFLKGEPISIFVILLRNLLKLGAGRRPLSNDENRTKNRLAATLSAAVGRLKLLRELHGASRYGNTDAWEEFVMQDLAKQWHESDFCRDAKELKELSLQYCQSRLETLHREGRQKLVWSSLYPHGTLLHYSDVWSKQYSVYPKHALKDEETFQFSLVLSLLKMNFRAERQFNALYELSKSALAGNKGSQSLSNQIVGSSPPDYVSKLEALPSAFAGDIDPSRLSMNLLSDYNELETMRLVGRLYRREGDVTFTPANAKVIREHIPVLEKWLRTPWNGDDETSAELAFWAKAMSRAMPVEGYKEQFGANS